MKIKVLGTSVILALAMTAQTAAHATSAVLTIDDASQLAFESDSNGKVYLRNLNQFDSAWSGCCFNYWLDTTTDAGKAQYSYLLSAFFNRQKITFYGDTAGGIFSHVGFF